MRKTVWGLRWCNEKRYAQLHQVWPCWSPIQPELELDMGAVPGYHWGTRGTKTQIGLLRLVASLLLVAMPGAPSSVLATSSDARSP